MKQRWKSWLKAAAGALTALALLNAFCAWYYNPTAYQWDDFRTTDTIREPGAFTSRATEGIAWSRIDENGYNNPSAPGEEGVSVLMMGSSHTEALNVAQDQSASARLEAMLRADGETGRVYNIGISSHNLPRNAANLSRALERFQPTDCVVIETFGLTFPVAYLMGAMDDSLGRLERTEEWLPDWITRQPLSKTLYHQWMELTSGQNALAEDSSGLDDEYYQNYEDMMTRWFTWMREITDAHGVRLIVYYHPHLLLQADGSAIAEPSERYAEAYAAAARRAGIVFLDMTQPFLDAYAAEYALPHGFCNTAAGAGHLNAKGHELIAEALYKAIREEAGA